jgi:hypothetical protein
VSGGKLVVVVLVALLVGLGVGYLVWGAAARRHAAELAEVQGSLAATRQAAGREGQLEGRVREAETRLNEIGGELAKETELRSRLEKVLKAKPAR